MAIKKGIWQEKQDDGSLVDLYPKTSADNVDETVDKKIMTANERQTLAELKTMKDNDEFGKVDDVQTNDGASIVTNKIAKLPNFALLGADGKIKLSDLPDAILGQLLFGGTINKSGIATLTTNFKSMYGISSATLQLTSTDYSKYQGAYFIAQDTSTFTNQTIIGVANVSTGDWIVSLGTSWNKIDNSDAVTSVAGRTGAVTLAKGDVGLSNVDNTSDASKNVASASKLSSSKTISVSGDISGSVSTDFSTNPTLTLTMPNITTAGTYSAVAVNSKGQVSSGGQVLEIGTDGQSTPSSSLVVGGLFFKKS